MGKAKRTRSEQIPTDLSPFLAPLAALQRLLERFDEQGVIIGGIATSLLARPRLTVDLDAVILLSIAEIPKLIQNAAEEGIVPRQKDAETFARKNRVLLLRHLSSNTNIDISLGILPFEVEMVERSQKLAVGAISLRLPTPEDLIVLKAVAHRPKDLLDIQAIIEIHPNLDRGRIEYWVKQFADALDQPELWQDISGWL
jgi:predicted nucleotidyltransferase